MWRPTDIGEVIAERELAFRQPGDEMAKVIVRFGKPVREPDSDQSAPWWCPIQVRGLGADWASSIGGEDSLQALVLALEFVTNYLPSRAERLGGELDWLDDREQLVFAGTFMREQYLAAINRLAAGLESALEVLEKSDVKPAREHVTLLRELRGLIRTRGFPATASGSENTD